MQIPEKNEKNNVETSSLPVYSSICLSTSLFVAIDELWVVNSKETSQLFHDQQFSSFPFFASLFVVLKTSELNNDEPIASCAVYVDMIVHGSTVISQSFSTDVTLNIDYSSFKGGKQTMQQLLDWSSSFCENFVTFHTKVKCIFGQYTSETESHKIHFLSCFGNVLSWDNLKVGFKFITTATLF